MLFGSRHTSTVHGNEETRATAAGEGHKGVTFQNTESLVDWHVLTVAHERQWWSWQDRPGKSKRVGMRNLVRMHSSQDHLFSVTSVISLRSASEDLGIPSTLAKSDAISKRPVDQRHRTAASLD